MNLLCPNCQKMLTVPEEFAGQMMKCPLCSGMFTVPGLPGASPPPHPSSEPETDIYSIRHDPSASSPPPPPAPPPPVSYSPPPPEPELEPAPLPSPKPSLAVEDHQRGLALSLNPNVLPWIAPACLVLVFFLQFFDWDGIYPGEEPAVSGNAWYAAFGSYTVDGDLKTLVPYIEDDKNKPGWSFLTIFYLLLFFPALIVTVGSVVITHAPIKKLPPQLDPLLPWRWGIVAAVNLFLFLFLGLQVLLGFSLDSRYGDWVEQEYNREIKDQTNPTSEQRKTADAHRVQWRRMLHRTLSLRLVVLLHLIAIVSAALMFWIDARGTHRPLPRLELRL